MFRVELSEQQMKNLYYCLDLVLKGDGLNSLAMVTDLHNALAASVVVQPEQMPVPTPASVPLEDEEGGEED
jgi:hypothetical protein